MVNPVIVISAIVAICAVIVIIILLACSYRRVDENYIGLLFSHASRRIDRTQYYPAGRYYVGVGGEFIVYPIMQQEMKLPPFEARTADGLNIELQVTINYNIDKNNFTKLLSLFDNFGRNYDGFLSRLAMNTLRDASARFNALEYSLNRSQVGALMETYIRDDMAEIGFRLDSVQLQNVQFPIKFSETLQNTLMQKQQVTQAERDKAAEIVSLEGELLKSQVTAQGMISDAMSEATTIMQNADADAQSLINTLEKEGKAHKSMIDMFEAQIIADSNGQIPPEKARQDANKLFVQWYWMNQVSSSPATKNVAVGVPSGLSNMPSP